MCPYYKNAEVFNDFNEIVVALGGQPMTEEEFRSKELRHKREGVNYAAMEGAYRLWHFNNGNMLDYAPNGALSKLFDDLLELTGDRAEAIRLKSEVYSDEFKNWFGDWTSTFDNNQQYPIELINLVFKRIPELPSIGTKEEYSQYLSLVFPESLDRNIYWHGSNSDFSKGFTSAKRGEGSGAPETKTRNDFYLAKQAWTVLQYVNGINRSSIDKNGFGHWNKLWWELKEIMSNGRRQNDDWKDLIINEENVRQAIPNKKGIFNRDFGGGKGKWLKERKSDYGYENKSDREFFEEILGVRWGKDTFKTWTQRNAEIFKSLEETEKGIFPAIINTSNPIRETGLNTYYEELRGLFTKADQYGNDAVISEKSDNEFNSDIAIVINASDKNIHFLGTKKDIDAFKQWKQKNNVSKVVDENGEPLIVYHQTDEKFNKFDTTKAKRGLTDVDTPVGIFTKENNDNIFYSLKNDVQIPLFLKIINIKVFNSRIELINYLNSIFPDHKNIRGRIELWEVGFGDVLDDVLEDAYNRKKEIVRHLINEGYDGFELIEDYGVHTRVSFNPNQVKSVLKDVLKNPYQSPTTRVGEFGTQNDLMASDINEELTYSKIYEPPRTYKLDISTEDDLMMSKDDEKTVRDIVDSVSPARPHDVYNSNGDVKVLFSAQSKDHLRTVVKHALKEAGFKLGKIIYAGNKVRAEVTKATTKKKSTVEVKQQSVTREEFYKYDMPLVEQERKEWEEFDKQYESPRTLHKDMSTNAEIMASALEDKREEYITFIGEKLTSALNLLYKSYQKQIGVVKTSREETKTKLLEKINEIKQLREKDQAELALLSVLEWGKTVLGIVPRQGGTIDPRTAYGFLSKSNKDTDGEFTNIDPNSLWNLYVNTIGFFENTLLPLLPSEDDGWFSEDVYRDIDTITKSLSECKKLWVNAVKKVTTRYISDFIDKEVVQPQYIKDNMKVVAEDWLTKNMFYGDIGVFNLYIANFGLNKNPIIKIAFHIIQYAETETNLNLHQLATPLAMKYKKADSLFRSGSFKRYASSSWQEILIEKDRNGVPTGKFVRDINYGQYEIDLNEFVEQLNAEWDELYGYHYIEDEYGYMVDTLNHFHAENQEWVEDGNGNLIQPNYYEYLSQIERWKDDHCDRRYTTLYYLERMSKPYRGYEDPATVKGELDGHGLSPKTLSKYRTIQNNINNYLSMCTNPDTGIVYPHKLGPTARKNLKYWQDMADDLSNPFERNGQLKDYEDRVVAYEIRAWLRYLGQETTSNVNWDLFDSELEKVREEAQRENNPLLVDDFIQTNTKWGIHPDYFPYEASPARESIKVVLARLIKGSLESLIKTDAGYTKNVAAMENNPEYFLRYQRQELFIANNRAKGDKDFAKLFNEHFVTKPILYRDGQGFYYTKNGVKLSSPTGISENSLMTWADYLEEKYADDIVSGGTLTLGILINEMYLPNGLLKSKDQIKQLLHDFVFTYVDIVTNQDGTKIAVNKTIGALTLVLPKKKTFKNLRTGKVENTIIRVPKGTFAERHNKLGSRLISYTYNHEDIHPEQPLRSKYDNSKNLKKVLNEPVLADLYESLINVMKESYKKHAPERSRYDYDLPKVNADVGAIISRMISRGFKNTADEIWKAMTTALPNDFGMLNVNDRIKSPDGSIGHSLPLRYVGKLKDRSTYSADVVGAVIAYAHMAENYKNKYKIESILNLMASNLDPNVRKELNKDEPYRNSDKSKTLIDALLDSSLYENQYSLGEKQTPEYTPPKTLDEILKNIVYSAISMGILGGVSFAAINPILGAILGAGVGIFGGIGASLKDNIGNKKLAAFFQRTESLQMLGSNVLSMVVGIGDASVKMIREAINSKYMNLLDLSKSFFYILLLIPAMILNIGNPIPNCKIIAMMQMNGVSKDTKRIYEHMNHGRIRKVLNNICLGGFSLLDYFTNSILLRAHYNNIRFYEGDLVDKGYYTYQELKLAIIDKGYDNAVRRAKIAYLSTEESLWDAYTFNGGTIEGKMKGLKDGGMLQIRSDREQYVTNRHKTLVRTKTIQRGALYNGMNPDNDVPLYKRTFIGAAAGAMRGWLTQQIEHLSSGGDDTSVREFVKVSESDTQHGTEKVNPSTKLKQPRTDKQLSEQMSWNYETGLPLDRIFMAILKSFDTLWKKAAVAIHIRKGNLKDIKFSYQEKYAWRNVLTTLGIMYVLMTGWPNYHTSIKDEIPIPQTREEAGATSLVDVPRYMNDIYFGKGVYKLTLDDIYFRTIESLLTGIDPTTMLDVVNALSVYKSGVSEQLEFVQSVGDAAGLTGHSSDEIIKRGSYKFYTRGERRLYKTYSMGQLDNLHTAFTYNGLWQNLNFYYNQYGKIYRFFGFDDFKVEKKAKESSGKRRGGSKRGSSRGGHKRGTRG